ncbi:hypothetical protein FA95DRAFT_1607528 [Auriscalpium vulgare]|uniref:Uncharacterized protein n=1 Tax=Auriscalpium vulgare TaxID=40419 RepID=A0ACB8RNJ5_9AGAM|nr:hypothetical protein FA95DRAFT_1607528 [Auriscalpium vulgare]
MYHHSPSAFPPPSYPSTYHQVPVEPGPCIMDDESKFVRNNSLARPAWSPVPDNDHHPLNNFTGKGLWASLAQRGSTRRVGVRAAPYVDSSRRKVDDVLYGVLQSMMSTVKDITLEEDNKLDGRSVAPENARYVFDQMAAKQAPMLERLYVENGREHMFHVPTHLFRGHVPQHFAALHLERCDLTFRSQLLMGTNLHALELHRCPNVWSSFAELAETFRRLPNIETLILDGCLPPAPDSGWPVGITPQPFYHVRHINLVGDVLQVSKVFACMIANPQTKLVLDVHSIGRSTSQWLAMVIQRHFTQGQVDDSFHTLHIEPSARIPGAAQFRVHCEKTSFGSLYITLPNVEDGLNLLAERKSAPYFREIESLVVDHPALENPQHWLILDRALHELSALVVPGRAMDALLNAMAMAPFEPLFPRLAYLSIQKALFNCAEWQGTFYDKLVKQLRHRADVGHHGPYQLDIQNSELTEHMVAELRHFFNSPFSRPRRLFWDNKLHGLSRHRPKQPQAHDDALFNQWMSFSIPYIS